MGLGSGIPDPGVKKATDAGCRIRIRNTGSRLLGKSRQYYGKELILHICMLQGTYYFLFVFYLSWPAWRPAVKWLLGGGPPAPPPQEKKAE
jgi:hypothetical protein